MQYAAMKYRKRRRVTTFTVILDTDWGKRNAEIVDVTEQGARLRLDVGNLDPGSEVALGIQGKTYPAKVIWNREGVCGVQFDELLSINVLGAINRSLRRAPSGRKQRFVMN